MASIIERLTKLEQEVSDLITRNRILRDTLDVLTQVIGQDEDVANKIQSDLKNATTEIDDNDDEGNYFFVIVCSLLSKHDDNVKPVRVYFGGVNNGKARWLENNSVARRFIDEAQAEKFLRDNKKLFSTPPAYYGPAHTSMSYE